MLLLSITVSISLPGWLLCNWSNLSSDFRPSIVNLCKALQIKYFPFWYNKRKWKRLYYFLRQSNVKVIFFISILNNLLVNIYTIGLIAELANNMITGKFNHFTIPSEAKELTVDTNTSIWNGNQQIKKGSTIKNNCRPAFVNFFIRIDSSSLMRK